MLIRFNRPVEVWDEVFGNQVVAAAILNQLLHHCHGVTIRGDSYWLREKRRSGLRGNSSNDKNDQQTQALTTTMGQHRTSGRPSQGGTIARTAAPRLPGVSKF